MTLSPPAAVTTPAGSRDQQHLEGRRLLAPARLVEPGDGEHLERAAEVEDLDVVEDHDSDSSSFHEDPPQLAARKRTR